MGCGASVPATEDVSPEHAVSEPLTPFRNALLRGFAHSAQRAVQALDPEGTSANKRASRRGNIKDDARRASRRQSLGSSKITRDGHLGAPSYFRVGSDLS